MPTLSVIKSTNLLSKSIFLICAIAFVIFLTIWTLDCISKLLLSRSRKFEGSEAPILPSEYPEGSRVDSNEDGRIAASQSDPSGNSLRLHSNRGVNGDSEEDRASRTDENSQRCDDPDGTAVLATASRPKMAISALWSFIMCTSIVLMIISGWKSITDLICGQNTVAPESKNEILANQSTIEGADHGQLLDNAQQGKLNHASILPIQDQDGLNIGVIHR